MTKNLLLIVLLGVLGFGCAAASGKPTKVVLKHPETLDFVTCTVGRLQSNSAYRENDECIRKYQQQGYVIWGESK